MMIKLKYKLKALFNPSSWTRLHKTNQAWDEELWRQLQSVNNIQYVGSHNAIIGGRCVWIANHPYSSGSTELLGKTCMCSRATSILLGEQLDKARILLTLKGLTLQESERAIFNIKYQLAVDK